MSLKAILTFLVMTFILAACQVKETSPSGGLVSDNGPAANKFTVTGPAAGNYVTGSVISFHLAFPFDLTVTGTPQIALTIGSTTQHANYISGSGTRDLLFQYTVQASDDDTNGIAITGLGLNGGTIQFDHAGTPTDAAVSSVTAKTYANVLIDNVAPTVSAFDFDPLNIAGYYYNGKTITFVVTFSEKVFVTGSPQLSVTFSGAGGLINPTYSGGSGTTALNFSYTVTTADFDKDGYTFGTTISLPSGATIKDASGNSANVTLSVATITTNSDARDVDGRLPHIISVTPPANGTYIASQNLDVTVEFDRPVSIPGSTLPYIPITIGSNVRQALYYSGTGTNTIVFRYTTIPGDVDADGIALGAAINMNTSGVINGSVAPNTCASNVAGVSSSNCFFGDTRNNVIVSPSTTGVIVNAIQPAPTSVNHDADTTLPKWGTAVADNVWIIGQDLIISVGFNTQMYVSQTLGTPRIPINLTSGTVYANYLSGGDGQTTLTFKYTIVQNDVNVTAGGITVGSIELNGGKIYDIHNTNATLTLPTPSWPVTKVDGIRPVISTVNGPAAGTYSVANPMSFTVIWSEAVKYTTTNQVYFPVDVGGVAKNAVYFSGDTTTTIVHRPNLASSNDNDGVVASSPMGGSSTVTDLAGNAATVLTFIPPSTTTALVDTIAPTVTSIVSPAAGKYKVGDTLNFTFNFSEPVTAVVSGAVPCITLTIGSTARCLLTTSSGYGTSKIFSYTIVAGENDTDGVVMGTTISSNASAYVRDVGMNNAAAFTAPNLTSVLVDNTAPTFTVALTNTVANYTSGTVLRLKFTYSEIVNVDTTGGTPAVSVTAGNGTLPFTYASGTGSTILYFEYTVGSNDYAFNGLSNPTSLALNGGTIKDVAGNAAGTTFTAVTLSGVTLTFPEVRVWTKNNFVNRITAGVTLTSVGAVTTTNCPSAAVLCRQFTGDDSLSLGGTIASADSIMIAFRTHTAVGATYDLFMNEAQLVTNTSVFNLYTPSGDSYVDSGSLSATSTNSASLAVNTLHMAQIDLVSPTSIPAGIIIPLSFRGGIAEIWILDGASTAKKDIIRAYLDAKF